MKHAWIGAVVIATSSTAQAQGTFDLLLEPATTWHYEVVTGNQLAKLAPVKEAPAAFCKSTVAPVEDVVRVKLRCTTDATPTTPGHHSFGGMLGLTVYQGLDLVIDKAGVRQVMSGDNAAVMKQRWNAKAFTFPAKVKGRWVHEAKERDVHVRVDVTPTRMTLGGTRTKVWLAKGLEKDRDPAMPARHTAAAFAPGIGPALLCTYDDKATPRWWCLRLVRTDAPT